MRSTAAKVAERKAKNPDLYCPQVRCLWATGGPLCPRHKKALATGKPEDHNVEAEQNTAVAR
jgi:hypothetical protein